MSILVYFYLLILFFGPKYSIFDTRLILIPVGFILSNGYIWNSRTLKFACTFLSFLFLYSLLLFFLNHFEYPDFMRYFRAIISIISLALLFNSKAVGYRKIINGFYYVFLTHALVMLTMLLFPASQQYIHKVLNFEIITRQWRVTGLTAGFDIAGIITIITSVFSYRMLELTGKRKYMILMFLSVAMTIFSSRANMIILVILLLIILFKYSLRTSYTLREFISLSAIFIIALFFTFKMIMPIFQQTINTEIFNSSSKANIDFTSASYNFVDPFILLKSFIVLPETLGGLIFGTSSFPYVDSGYFQIINAVGLVGLILTIAFYIELHLNCRLFYLRTKSGKKENLETYAFFNTSAIVFILTLVASVKNQYFFTRSVFEIFIFFSFLLEYCKKTYAREV